MVYNDNQPLACNPHYVPAQEDGALIVKFVHSRTNKPRAMIFELARGAEKARVRPASVNARFALGSCPCVARFLLQWTAVTCSLLTSTRLEYHAWIIKHLIPYGFPLVCVIGKPPGCRRGWPGTQRAGRTVRRGAWAVSDKWRHLRCYRHLQYSRYRCQHRQHVSRLLHLPRVAALVAVAVSVPCGPLRRRLRPPLWRRSRTQLSRQHW